MQRHYASGQDRLAGNYVLNVPAQAVYVRVVDVKRTDMSDLVGLGLIIRLRPGGFYPPGTRAA